MEFNLEIQQKLLSILMKSNLIYNCSEFSYIVDDEKTDKDVIQNYTISNYPKELENKVSLLQYFRKSLINESIKRNNKEVLNSIVYLKKWAKAKNAMLFKLSNKIIESIFYDKTKIMLKNETKEIIYVNTKGGWENYSLPFALKSTNAEMTKRLRYTKDILKDISFL